MFTPHEVTLVSVDVASKSSDLDINPRAVTLTSPDVATNPLDVAFTSPGLDINPLDVTDPAA